MKNEYTVTKALYRRWILESMLRGSRLGFFIFWSLCAVAAMIYAFCFGGGAMFVILALYCFYFTIPRYLVYASVQYKRLAQVSGKENWTCSIAFEEDAILIAQANTTVKQDYAKIQSVSEKSDHLLVRFNNKTVMHLYKDAFTGGTWQDCKALLEKRAGLVSGKK